jgi:hypothetical protein
MQRIDGLERAAEGGHHRRSGLDEREDGMDSENLNNGEHG